MAIGRVWAYLLLLHPVPWGLLYTAVDVLEELGSLQVFREWPCEADQGLVFVKL